MRAVQCGSVPLSERLHPIVSTKLTTAVPRGRRAIAVKKNRRQNQSTSSGAFADDRAGDEKEKIEKKKRNGNTSQRGNVIHL